MTMSNTYRIRPGIVREIRTPIVLRSFDHAQFIPSGMHGYSLPFDHAQFIPSGMHQFHNRAAGYMQVAPAYERAVTGLGDSRRIERTLVARGVHPDRARAIVARAAVRAGLGDDEPTGPTLADVQAKAGDYENAHRTLIAQLGATADGDAGSAERLQIRNVVEGLYDDWTTWAVSAKGGVAPYQWDRTNPVDAILIAVRDDLRNTADLLAANKAQQVLGKQIQAYGGGFKLPSIDLPWGWLAAVAGGLLALKFLPGR
jgi:hypothetical protein